MSLFQLILGIFFKLTSDAIDKDLKVPKVFSEENLELRLCDWSGSLMAMLVLGLFKIDSAAEEGGGKWGTIHFYGT